MASSYLKDEIVETVKAYYQACKEENMNAYLAIMYLEEEDAALLAEEARRVWAAIDTLEYSLEEFSVALNDKKDLAIAQYAVKAQIAPEDGSPEENFRTNADYVMVLRHDGGRWKVEVVQRKDLFLQSLKSLYTLQNFQELVELMQEDTAREFLPAETKSQNERSPTAAAAKTFTLITDEKDGFIFSTAQYTNDYEKADLFVVPWIPHPHVHERIIDMGTVSPDEVIDASGKFSEADLKAGHTYLAKGRDGKIYRLFVEKIEKNESKEEGMVQANYEIAFTYRALP